MPPARPRPAAPSPVRPGPPRLASRAPPPLSERLSRAWAGHPVAAFFLHGRRITVFRQLHSLVKAGTGLPMALDQLARWASPSVAASLKRVKEDVEAGDTFGAALRRHARDLDPASIELVAFAEETGKLEPVLARVIEHLEQMQKLRWNALVGALWPAYLMFAQVFVGPLLGLGAALSKGAPKAALPSIYLSGLVTNLTVVSLAFAAIFAFPFAIAAFRADEGWDRFKLSLPGPGTVVRDLYASRLCFALSLAQGAGVEVHRMLEIAALATTSPLAEGRVFRAKQVLREGRTLAEALDALELLPRQALGTVAVAETAGTLEATFATIARETQASAVRGLRMLVLAVLGIVAVVLLVAIVKGILGTLFGPVYDYYHQGDNL